MSVEPIRLRASDGESGPAEAEIIRYGKVQLFGGPVQGGKPRTCPRCRIALELLPVVDDQSAGRT